ncbi:MAG TPA: universal stress protein [Myxococcales bacterium]|nr:universal stress protein [Myxococcales bacterium]
MAAAPLGGSLVAVGTDGSEGGRRAVSFAAGLADALQAKLEIVFVARGPPAATGEGPIDAGQQAKGEDILQGELDRLRYLGLHATKRLLSGDPAEALADHANRSPEVGLLVIGRRGAGPLVRALAGSVASRMAHLTQKPLVIVP